VGCFQKNECNLPEKMRLDCLNVFIIKKNPFFMIIPAKTVSVCSNKNSPLVLKQTKKLKRRGGRRGGLKNKPS
jgi:hypothetical protein